MCKKQLLSRHWINIFALVAINIMVASLFTPLFGGPVPLRLSSGTAMAQSSTMPMVAAGFYHTVGLKSDGTVVAVGDNEYGQCNVNSWTGIKQVAAGSWHTVGLKSDGTVVATGYNGYGQCNVSSWTGIIQVAAGNQITLGVRSDGTVLLAGSANYGSSSCDVSSWTGIRQVAGGWYHAVGLKSVGTVVATGYNGYGACNVSSWTGITEVAAGCWQTVGLKSAGTVVATGNNSLGQCNVSSWTGVIQVAAGGSATVGLKSDGTVVATGDNASGQCNVISWTGITEVAAGDHQTVGLKSDGSVVAVGDNSYGQCNVSDWKLGTLMPTPRPTPTPTPGTNLIVNPGFEKGLTGWNTSQGTAVYSVDCTTSHSGSCSAEGVETNTGSLGRLYQDVTSITSAGNQYQISGWIKTSNVIGAVVIALDYVGAGSWSPADGYVREIGYVSGTNDWTYFESGEFTLPPMPADCVATWFLFDFNNGSGTAWWDDVSLVCTSTATPTLTPTTTTVASSAPYPSVYGYPVSFTATVSPTIGTGTPTGTVQFSIDGSILEVDPLSSGNATSSAITSLSVGNHTITAVYSGDTNFATSTGNLTQTVIQGITFTESGLPDDTVWGVILNGNQTATNYSPKAIPLEEENGTYDFYAFLPLGGTVSGWTIYPISGQIPLNGSGATRAISFTPNPNGNFTNFALPEDTWAWSNSKGSDWCSNQGACYAIGSMELSWYYLRGVEPSLPNLQTISAKYAGNQTGIPDILQCLELTQSVWEHLYGWISNLTNPYVNDQKQVCDFLESEINAGRPVMVLMSGFSGLSPAAHAVVAYGFVETSDQVEFYVADPDYPYPAPAVPLIYDNSSGSFSYYWNWSGFIVGYVPLNTIVSDWGEDVSQLLGETTTRTTIQNGAASAVQGNVSVDITGSTAANGTSVSISATDFASVQPASLLGAIQLSGAQYYDVEINPSSYLGSQAEAQICITSPYVTANTTMWYWNGNILGILSPAGNCSISGSTMCGDVPAGALGGTPIVIGTQMTSTTTLTSSANPSVYDQPLTFTANVTALAPATGTPTGNVTFNDGASVLGNATLDSSGQATYTISTLNVGNHTIVAAYGGDTNFAGSSGNLTQTVNQASSATTPSSTTTPTPTPTSGKKTNIGVIIGAIIAVIVIGLLMYWFLSRRKPPVPPTPTTGAKMR